MIGMNLANVKIGDIFSTETKLFRKLELVPPKGGKALDDMRKRVKRHIEYEKTGKVLRNKVTNEIGITNIIEFPTEPIDGRVNNGNHKYPELDDLVLDYITRVSKDEITLRQLLVAIGAIDERYKNYEKKQDSIMQELQHKMCGINKWQVYMVFKQIKEKCLDNLETCIERLSKQGKIKYEKYMLVVDEDTYEAHMASQKEVEIVKNNEMLALKALIEDGVVSEKMTTGLIKGHYSHKKKFNKMVDNYNHEDGIEMYWNTYNIEVVDGNVLNNYDRNNMQTKLRQSLSEQIKETLNNYKYVKPKYKYYIGKRSVYHYNRPFNIDYEDGSGYYMMVEIVNYFFGINEDTRQCAIDNFTECQKEMIEFGMYEKEKLLPRCFNNKGDLTSDTKKSKVVVDDTNEEWVRTSTPTWDEGTESWIPF